MIETLEKTCLECGSSIRGRMDKKFCSDQCRSTHNHRIKTDDSEYVRRVNAILRRNRIILKEYIQNGKNRIHGEILRLKGFDFHYFTSTVITKEGENYFYCYDHGYVQVEGDFFLILVKEKFL